MDLRDRSGICQLVMNPERAPEAAETAHAVRNEFVLRAEGEVVHRAPEAVNPNLRDRRGRAPGRHTRDPLDLDAAALPTRRGGRRRDSPPALPLARPPPGEDAAQHRAAQPARLRDQADDGGGRIPRDRDADPLQADPRGRARLHRPEPPPAGTLLRAAAVAADPQAAARHRRLRPLLPDRAVLPGRGPPCRPRAGDHAARRRDGLPGPGVPLRPDGEHGPDTSGATASGSSSRSRSRA